VRIVTGLTETLITDNNWQPYRPPEERLKTSFIPTAIGMVTVLCHTRYQIILLCPPTLRHHGRYSVSETSWSNPLFPACSRVCGCSLFFDQGMRRRGGKYKDNERVENVFHSFGSKIFSDSRALTESGGKHLPF
jgi:hypothetical protein